MNGGKLTPIFPETRRSRHRPLGIGSQGRETADCRMCAFFFVFNVLADRALIGNLKLSSATFDLSLLEQLPLINFSRQTWLIREFRALWTPLHTSRFCSQSF